MSRRRCARLLLLAPAVLLAAAEAQELIHPDWQVADVGRGTKPSFDFDAADRLHVMGMTENPATGVVWYAKADTLAGPWRPENVAQGYFYGPGDLRVDLAGRAHMAWHDHSNQSPQHVMVATDGMATSHILPSPSHDGWDDSLCVDRAGNVHLACVDPAAFGASQSLQYGVFDGNSWTFSSAIAGSGSFMYGLNTSIALDSSSTPHVLYCRAGDWFDRGALVHASAGAAGWSFETVASGMAAGRFPSLAIDARDHLHAAWLDVDPLDHSTATVRYGTRAPGEGAAWAIAAVAVLEHVYLEFDGARKSVSIALDSAGVPHLAYADTRTIGYASLADGKWEKTTVLEHPDAIYRSLAVLRLDSEDQPCIALWQSHQGTDTVRLAQRPGGSPRGTIDLGLGFSDGTISYRTGAAGTYQLESSPDLKSWQPQDGEVVTDGAPQVIGVAVAPGTRRYYRVVFQPH